jgi:hypothetical protein
MQVDGVTLGTQPLLARVKKIVLDYDLTQLLQGKLVINQILVDHPQLTAVSKNGVWNFQPLLDLAKPVKGKPTTLPAFLASVSSLLKIFLAFIATFLPLLLHFFASLLHFFAPLLIFFLSLLSPFLKLLTTILQSFIFTGRLAPTVDGIQCKNQEKPQPHYHPLKSFHNSSVVISKKKPSPLSKTTWQKKTALLAQSLNLSKNYFWQHSTPLSRLTGGCGR